MVSKLPQSFQNIRQDQCERTKENDLIVGPDAALDFVTIATELVFRYVVILGSLSIMGPNLQSVKAKKVIMISSMQSKGFNSFDCQELHVFKSVKSFFEAIKQGKV